MKIRYLKFKLKLYLTTPIFSSYIRAATIAAVG